MYATPELRLHCPQCSRPDHLVRDERLVGDGSLVYLRCTGCGWEKLEPHGSREARAQGTKIYDAEMTALRLKLQADGARINADRAARERQERLEKSEQTALAWAGGPIQDRIKNFGSGYVVALPTLENGIVWRDLSQEVRTTCDRASAEAEEEAQRRTAADVARIPALQAQGVEAQSARIREEAAEARRRRAERSDVELSTTT